MAPKYVKKAVVIEALQWTGDNAEQMAEFMGELYPLVYADEKLRIETLEGPIYADLGDYVICGIKGEFYPCKPDIFKLTYDKV